MSRKKKETTVMTEEARDARPDAQAPPPPDVPIQTPPTADAPAAPEPPPRSETAPPASNGARRPAASWKYPVAAGVTVEVALWPHTITLQSGEAIEVFNATISRSYKDGQGVWQKGGSYRVAEIPVLVHALLRAHGFALDCREQNCPI